MTFLNRRKGGRQRADLGLLKSLLIRLMTRNEEDRTKAMLDRAQLEKNLLTLGAQPEAHLGGVMQIIARGQENGHAPGFEAGLMFGVTLALSAASEAGRVMLHKMLADIQKQQEDQAPTIEPVPDNVTNLKEI